MMEAINAMQKRMAEITTAAIVPGVQVSFMGEVGVVRISRRRRR